MSERNSRALFVRLIELLSGAALALACFLVLLWILNLSFPDATGLGELLRHREALVRSDSNLFFDVTDTGPAIVATLTSIHREVKQKPSTSIRWDAAAAGTPLEDRHAVQTYAGSDATISFGGQNEIRLDEKSLLIVRNPRSRAFARRKRASVIFVDGVLHGRLTPGQESEIQVLTGGGSIRAAAGGGEAATFSIAASPDQAATLSVYSGTTEVAWGETTTVVRANHAVVFDPIHGPGAPLRLPRRPRIVTPDAGWETAYRAAPRPVHFEWTAKDDTEGFRLVIAKDAGLRQVVHDDTVTGRTFVHGNLTAGDYFWQVRGVRDRAEGPASPAMRFTVARDQDPPPLDVLFPPADVSEPTLSVRGATEPGSRIVISDTLVPTNELGEFEHRLQLRRGYNFIVVQAVDPVGNTAFRSHTVNAVFSAHKRSL